MKPSANLPIQKLLDGEFLRVTRLHKDLNQLSVIPHRHDHYELMLVTKGEGIHYIDFKPYGVKPGRLYFIQPGQVHLIDKFDRDGWLVMFGEELFKLFVNIHNRENETGLLDSYTTAPYIDVDDELNSIVTFLIEQLQHECGRAKADASLTLHYTSLLLLHANRAHIVQHGQVQSVGLNRGLLHQLKQLINLHLRQQHQAAFYAEALLVDIKKLNGICREATQMTVFELLQERLLTESKILLQTSEQSVKEISYELGFNDPAFFGRFFKRHTGITPADFRNVRMI
ncbi:helix-turn-helix domain-containing protein [Mucilaginibacter terrae]|uniref:AraC family transcriptional activator of pobA n=1 Tax=Mucilaginibacter terrae TaxID=1955052 RepID=A0ABU3GUC4_9SPHI|nr:helix-turn-helix domain-containing protein [Mucilaginibacter terrae]MDT3402562.1 AraC family transcriptional activator of pobA [Mucilaginibacter terrae]